MWEKACNRQTVRSLMRSWSKAVELEDHPFIHFQAVHLLCQRQSLHPVDALRQVVFEAMQIAWPLDATLQLTCRKREIIQAHYWQEVPLKELARKMYLDERTVRRILAQALDDLVDALNQIEAHVNVAPALHGSSIQLAPSLALHPLLVGRDAVLLQLVDALESGNPLIALTGLPGSGKTALLAHLARREEVRRRFPDGVLWADLLSQMSLNNNSLHTVLNQWAFALGLPKFDLKRAANNEALLTTLIRSALEARRLLIVLSNAASPEWAKKLLLGGPACCHLVASPFSDLDLHLAPAQSVRLPPLTPAASRQLIGLLTPGLSHFDGEALDEVIGWCTGLPLALTAIGHYLTCALCSNQQRRIEMALSRLREPHSRLLMLADKAEPALYELAQVVQTHIAPISPACRRALQGLAILLPAAFDEASALAVLGGDVASLDALVDMGLIECSAGLYSLHPVIRDVLRAYAATAAVEPKQRPAARVLLKTQPGRFTRRRQGPAVGPSRLT